MNLIVSNPCVEFFANIQAAIICLIFAGLACVVIVTGTWTLIERKAIRK